MNHETKMSQLQHTQTRWSKSFPTEFSSVISVYTCTYEGRLKSCNKSFSRQCDLRRHQLNHTRPSKCTSCNKAFVSSKDLERHKNSKHNTTSKYCCPYPGCWHAYSADKIKDDYRGFSRKDYVVSHLRTQHKSTLVAVRQFKKDGLPMAVLQDEKWSLVLDVRTKKRKESVGVDTSLSSVVIEPLVATETSLTQHQPLLQSLSTY